MIDYDDIAALVYDLHEHGLDIVVNADAQTRSWSDLTELSQEEFAEVFRETIRRRDASE